MNNTQKTLFNSIISDIDKHIIKKEKIKEEILHQLLMDYKHYKINKTMDEMDVEK